MPGTSVSTVFFLRQFKNQFLNRIQGTEEGREGMAREMGWNFPPLGSLFTPVMAGYSLKPWAKDSVQVSHVGGRVAVTYCLPSSALIISCIWELKPGIQSGTMILHSAGVLGSVLTVGPNIWLSLFLSFYWKPESEEDKEISVVCSFTPRWPSQPVLNLVELGAQNSICIL